jgi:MutS domain V
MQHTLGASRCRSQSSSPAPVLPNVAASGLAFLRAVIGYLNLLLFIDGTMLCFGVPRLRTQTAHLLAAVAALGDIDAALAVASFRASLDGWTRPTFLPATAHLRLTDVRHPLVAGAVPNSMELCPPHGVLITGSNMSGKSTWLRAVGVNAVLAQSIATCVASRYEAPYLTVRSCIVRADDILRGKSTLSGVAIISLSSPRTTAS